MNDKKVLFYTLFTLIVFTSPNFGNPLEEEWVQNYLSDVDRRFSYFNTIALDRYSRNESFANALQENIRSLMVEASRRLREVSTVTFRNQELRRQVEILKNAGTFSLSDAEWTNFQQTIEEFKLLADMFYDSNEKEMIRRSSNSNEVFNHWRENREKLWRRGKIALQRYLTLYRQSAMRNRQQSAVHQHYSKFSDSNFILEMQEIMLNLRPIFLQFHGYIRHVLRTKYGPNVVSEENPIPHHLIEQILMHSWNDNRVLPLPYPNTLFPDVEEKLIEFGYQGLKTVEVADEFFLSLGFQDLPFTFWTRFSEPITNGDDGANCRTKIFDFKSNAAIKYCTKPNFETFLDLQRKMTSLHYINRRKNLPIGLNDEPCPGFTQSLEEAIILSTSSPNHVENIGLLRNFNYNEEMRLNRLFRLGVQVLFAITRDFVHEKLFVDMLKERIRPDQYNCEYWRLMNDYMGIEPPGIRNSNNFDLPSTFYENIDGEHTFVSNFVSKILGYEIYKSLCLKTKENGTEFSLQNCDFYESRKAGAALGQIMSMGATKSWQQTIEPLLGTGHLNGDAIIEYFEPVLQWIQEQNRIHRVPVGWESSNKCHT